MFLDDFPLSRVMSNSRKGNFLKGISSVLSYIIYIGFKWKVDSRKYVEKEIACYHLVYPMREQRFYSRFISNWTIEIEQSI